MASWKMRSHGKDESAEGSLLISIGDALERIQEWSSSDESIALAANKIVRRYLDKRCITYREYKIWRQRNRLIFTPFVDEHNSLIGFFDIFPLTRKSGEDVIAGKLTERSFKVDHIVPLAEIDSATYLHIATILINPRQRAFSPIVAKETLLLKMREFIEAHYAPVESRTYTAFAQTKAGERLLKRCGFSVAVLANDNEQRTPLYVLGSAQIAKTVFRFNRADYCLERKSSFRGVDEKIQGIELQLRMLIVSKLEDDPDLLPPHVSQNANERINSAAQKNAVTKRSRYQNLSAKLEFCDLRELENIITSKPLWPRFQPIFVNKETLVGKFGQMVELRNGIRHSRTIDEIMQKEGEAGIIWFERILKM